VVFGDGLLGPASCPQQVAVISVNVGAVAALLQARSEERFGLVKIALLSHDKCQQVQRISHSGLLLNDRPACGLRFIHTACLEVIGRGLQCLS
jgi:hypothetical protein